MAKSISKWNHPMVDNMTNQQTRDSAFPTARETVLPPNTSAYVAELTRDPSKARDFLIRAGIWEALPSKRRAMPKRTQLKSVSA